LRVVLHIDDHLITATGGAVATITGAAIMLRLLRNHARVQAAWSALRGPITLHSPVAVPCPECDGVAAIAPGCYFICLDELIRESKGYEEAAWPSRNFLVTTAE
jgi:hypothetical protein